MTRWGRRVIGLAAAACFVLAAASCSGEGAASTSTMEATRPRTTALELSEEQTFELQARAIARAWPGSRLCLVEESTPAELRAALAPLYEEILYVEIDDQWAPSVGWEHCTVVSAMPVRTFGPGAIGVDVWIMRGFLNGIGESYLFRWDGSAWVDTTPKETGVTVTTSVS